MNANAGLENSIEQERKPFFHKNITLGNILTILTLGLSAVGLYSARISDLAIINYRADAQEKAITELKNNVNVLRENQVLLVRLQEQLNGLLADRNRK